MNKDIDTETDKRNRKSAESSRYIGYCEQLKLDTQIDESVFRVNYEKIQELNTSVPAEIEKLSEKKVRLNIEQESKEVKVENLQQQITSLLARKNRIPDDLINARKRLIDILETTEEELPFVGELIKVKTTEQLWEDSIEKLLHNFSMQLLVPEKFSKAAISGVSSLISSDSLVCNFSSLYFCC